MRSVALVVGDCAWCGERFRKPVTDPSSLPRYCSRNHRELHYQQKRRRRREEAAVARGECPRPRKIKFDSHEAAEAHFTAEFPDDDRLHTYDCSCGFVHFGHLVARGTDHPSQLVEDLTGQVRSP